MVFQIDNKPSTDHSKVLQANVPDFWNADVFEILENFVNLACHAPANLD
jgi:hypothetical protein